MLPEPIPPKIHAIQNSQHFAYYIANRARVITSVGRTFDNSTTFAGSGFNS